MLAGPSAGLTATTSVPGAATARAARPMPAVMAAVVLGLITTIFTGGDSARRTGLPLS